ncbi:GNAT family N-acetyltransferase [Caproiciproducens sp.]
MELVTKKFKELTLDELYDILKLRVDVFVVEQNCPYHEMDDLDQSAYHVYLKDDEGIQAYLRVLDAGAAFDEVAIGRVVARKRRCGLGTQILSAGIETAKRVMGAKKIKIEAQTYAWSLYEKAGFRQISEEFLEDGIPHILMMLEI